MAVRVRPARALWPALLCLAVTACTAEEELQPVDVSVCLPHPEDFGRTWWQDHLPRHGDGPFVRWVRTGRYALALDVRRLAILHLGSPEPDVGPVSAELELQLRAGGAAYRCAGGGAAKQHSGPRLIEAGRFLQRFDVTDLTFQDNAGNRLEVDARLEVVAWPDRLAFLLDVRPGPETGDAEATIRLKTGGVELTDQTDGLPGLAAVSLEAGPDGLRPARPETPVRVSASAIPSGDALPVDYDAVRGWHRVDLDGIVPEGDGNDALERTRLHLANPSDEERLVRLLLSKNGAGLRVRGVQAMTGMSPLLRDGDGYPTGLPVQISKNWHSQADLELVYQGAWFHPCTVLRLPPRSSLELELNFAYAHWGGVPAASHAQLCLIGWGGNQLWHEAALGAWGESVCFDPEQGLAANAVCDVRPLMVHAMRRDEPLQWMWTNNVGGADFFRTFDADGRRREPVGVTAVIRRGGPVLTEATYTWQSDDGALDQRVTAGLYRSDDIVRGVYRLRLDVREAADVSRCVIFQVGADSYSYTGERKMAVGNEDGLVREWSTEWGGERYRTEPLELTGRVPWLSLHEAVSRDASKSGAWADRGIVIRSWRARLGGRPASPWAAEYGVKARGTDTSVMDLVAPPGVTRLLPGDFVEATVEHLVLPQHAADYYGPNAALSLALQADGDTWRMVRREAVGNDLTVEVARGELVALRPKTVAVADGRTAELTVTGGLGYVPLTFTGLRSYRAPLLEVRQGDGPWQVVDQAVHGKDFWQADYDPPSGTWDLSYSVPAGEGAGPGPRRSYRLTLAGD